MVGHVLEAGKGIVLVINKWDVVEKDGHTADAWLKVLRREAPYLAWADIVFASAQTGQRMERVLREARRVAEERYRRVPADLNRVVTDAVRAHPPSHVRNRLGKVLYATQVAVAPPTFVIFVNDPELIHFSYRRYLENRIRDEYGFLGTPIRLIFRERASEESGAPLGTPAADIREGAIQAPLAPTRDNQRVTRILLYTGKGGVGRRASRLPRPSPAPIAGCGPWSCRPTSPTRWATPSASSWARPTEIAPNLWGQESDVFHNVAKYWGRIQEYAASVLRWRGLDDVLADEMTVLPGMDEVGSLLWIAEHHDSGDYDVVVVDAAPTGETLRLLSMPEAGRWWMEKIEPIGRRITKLTGPIIQRVVGMPIPSSEVFDAGEELFRSSSTCTTC